ESLAIERVKKLFSAEHANVQPHSGSQANMAAYLTAAKPGDTILGMNLSHGGHLTHGHPLSFSGKDFKVVAYGAAHEDERLDYDELARLARDHRPKIIIAGASAYVREIDFARFGEVAKETGAALVADIAHIAGLVIAGLHNSPVPHAPFVTSTTHKTLRGPRGGLVLCRTESAKDLDRNVLPGLQGGPLEHVIAAKPVAFGGAGVRRLPATDRRQREGPGEGSHRPRIPAGLGRDRQPHDARGRRGAGRLRQGRREGPGPRPDHRQQEHDSLRHAAAAGRVGS